jgi:hypothetical protein
LKDGEMKAIKYVGPHPSVEVETGPRLWIEVKNGDKVEVSDELAARLLEQFDNWTETKPKSGKPTANTEDGK